MTPVSDFHCGTAPLCRLQLAPLCWSIFSLNDILRRLTAVTLCALLSAVASPLRADEQAAVDENVSWARQLESSLGASLAGFAGVEARYFGPLSSAPLIRGFGDERIALLSNGSALSDFSSYAPRFNVAMDPMRAKGAKLLYGVESLAYGSGLLGGAVDLDAPLVPMAPIDGIEWDWLSRGSDYNQGGAGFSRFGAGNGKFALRLEGLARYSNDYEPAEPQAPNTTEDGSLHNTDGASSGGGIGLSWTNKGNYFGLGYSQYDSEYGLGKTSIPGENPRVNIESKRYEMRAGFDVAAMGVDEVDITLIKTQYRHKEALDNLGLILNYAPSESGSSNFDTTELRVDALLMPVWGWQPRIGIQAQDREESSADPFAETPTERRQSALYLIPEKNIGDSVLSLGLRAQEVEQKFGESVDDERNTPVDLWTALKVPVAGSDRLQISVGRGQRAPSESELQTPAQSPSRAVSRLELESSYNAGIDYQGIVGNLDYGLDVRASEISDYIDRGAEQGATRGDVSHYSALASANYRFNEHYSLGGYASAVRAEYRSGEYLAGIPGDRAGLIHRGVLGALAYQIEYSRVFDQDRVGPKEAPTDGHELLNLDLEYQSRWKRSSLWIALRGRNLLDADVRGHQSQNPNKLPLPGARVYLDFRFQFEPRSPLVRAPAPAVQPLPVPAPVAARPSYTPPPVEAPQRIVTQLAFAEDSAELSSQGRAAITAILPRLREIGGHLVIEGHTDSRGAADYNQSLSLRRAEAVKAYLVQQGFSSEEMTVIGHGEMQPIASNASVEGRAKNRRVEFYAHPNS